MSRKLFLLLLGVALATACSETNKTGSSGVIDAPVLDVSGTWMGTWTSDNPPNPSTISGTGDIVMVFDQRGQVDPRGDLAAEVTSASLSGTTCWDGVVCIVGTSCPSVSLGFVEVVGRILLFLNPDPAPAVDHRLDVTLDMLGNELNGTYLVETHSDPNCIGDTGTITATRMDP